MDFSKLVFGVVISLLLAHTVSATCTGTPPTSGVWTVVNTTTCSDMQLILDDHLVINASLTFDNVTFLFNSSEGTFTLNNSATFTVNHSNISVTNIASGKYRFFSTGRLTIENSYVTNAGDGTGTDPILFGNGINIQGPQSTIRNTTVRATTVATGVGIYVYNTGNTTLHGNTITTDGDSDSHGIFSQFVNNMSIVNNTITTAGSNDNYGVYLYESSLNNILYNTIKVLTDSISYGVYMDTSNNNTVDSNIINATGSLEEHWSIYVESCSGTTITNNTVLSTGSRANYGIYVSSCTSHVENNQITTVGTAEENYGIYLSSTSSATFRNNTIATEGTTTNYGFFFDSSDSNVIEKITVTTEGEGENYGFYFDSSNHNMLTNITIQTNGSDTDNYGVYMDSVTNNTLVDSTVRTNGTSDNYGLYLSATTSSKILRTTFITDGSEGSNYGIYLATSSLNNVTATNVNTFGTSTGNDAIYILGNSDTNIFKNVQATTNTNSFGLLLQNSGSNRPENNQFWDGTLSAINNDVRLTIGDSTSTNYFVNMTLNYSDISLSTPSTLDVGWWVDVQVNATNQTNVTEATVLLFSVNGTEWSATTNASGLLRQATTEYLQYQSSKAYVNNYSINVTHPSFYSTNGSLLLNTSTSMNFSLQAIPPGFRPLTINAITVNPLTKTIATPISLVANISNVESNGSVICTLSGDVNGSSTTTSGEAVLLNYSFGLLATGSYNYNLSCSDELNITSTTGSFGVANATSPDLRVFTGYVHLSNTNPDANQPVQIYGEVENIGFGNASNVSLIIKHQQTTICNTTFASLAGFGSRAVMTPCTYSFPTSGVQIVSLIADEGQIIAESNEDNNVATHPVFVGVGNDLEGVNITGSLSSESLFIGETFTVTGSAVYSTTGETVKGATANLFYQNTNQSTFTTSNGSIPAQTFSAGQTPGNFTVNITVTDQFFMGSLSLAIEVRNISGGEGTNSSGNSSNSSESSEDSCPTSHPDPDLVAQAITFSEENCAANAACSFTVQIGNLGCPVVNETAVLLQDTSISQTIATTTAGPVAGEGGTTVTGLINWTPTLSGFRSVKTTLDNANTITEENENNNALTRIRFVYPSLPDLQPATAVVPSGSQANTTVNLTFTLSNGGGVTVTENFFVDLYVNSVFSQRKTITQNATAFGGQVITPFNFTPVANGQHNVSFVVDATDTVSELLETNNNYSAFVSVESGPDLRLLSLNVSNTTNVLQNQIVDISASFDNVGDLNVTTAVNMTITVNGTTVNTSSFATAVIGQSHASSVSVNLTAVGSTTIQACVDPEDVISEAGFGGTNCQSVSFVVLDPDKTELATSSIDVSIARSYLYIYEPTQVTVTSTNTGSQAAAGVSVALNTSSVTTQTVNVSEFGGSVSSIFNFTPSSFGTQKIEAVTDSNNAFTEDDETNNRQSTTKNVIHPDIRVTSSDIFFSSSAIYLNETINVTTILHDDSVFKAMNVSLNVSIGTEHLSTIVSEIPADSSQSAQLSYTSSESGFLVVTVSTNTVFLSHEEDTTNNVATSSLYVKSCTVGTCISNITVNEPSTTVSGTFNISAFVYNEDNSTDGSAVAFWIRQNNGSYTFIGSTNQSTGDLFSVGGDGALYQVPLATTAFANGIYEVLANSTMTNLSSTATIIISNTAAVEDDGGGRESPARGAAQNAPTQNAQESPTEEGAGVDDGDDDENNAPNQVANAQQNVQGNQNNPAPVQTPVAQTPQAAPITEEAVPLSTNYILLVSALIAFLVILVGRYRVHRRAQYLKHAGFKDLHATTTPRQTQEIRNRPAPQEARAITR